MSGTADKEGREACPCETHGRCDVYQQLLRGEVNSKEYVTHIKRVVRVRLSRTLWFTEQT